MKLKLFLALLGPLLAFAPPSRACSLMGCNADGHEMQQNFVVHIAFAGRPLAGVTVDLQGFGGADNGKTLFSGLTGPDGSARVPTLPEGLYWLRTEYLEISAGIQCFHIGAGPSRKAKKQVGYEWGDLTVGVERAEGRLVDSRPSQSGSAIWNLSHRVDVPIAQARLKLQSPRGGAVYVAKSEADGRFTFGDVPRGIYVLHIEGGVEPTGAEDETTDLLIELRPNAPLKTMTLATTDGGLGGCGDASLMLRNE